MTLWSFGCWASINFISLSLGIPLSGAGSGWESVVMWILAIVIPISLHTCSTSAFCFSISVLTILVNFVENLLEIISLSHNCRLVAGSGHVNYTSLKGLPCAPQLQSGWLPTGTLHL